MKSARQPGQSASSRPGLGATARAALLLAAAAGLFAPSVAAIVLLAVAAGGWWWARAAGRRLLSAAAVLVLAALAGELAAEAGLRDSQRLRRRIQESYTRMWRQLDEVAERAATRLEQSSGAGGDQLRTFEVLGDEVLADSDQPYTLLLLDEAGTFVAWAGKGLLHDSGSERLVERGRSHQASFSAVSLLSVRPLGAELEGWRLAAGRSLRTDSFPFAPLAGDREPRWSLVSRERPVGAELVRFEPDEGPALVVEASTLAAAPPVARWQSGWRRAAMAIWGLALLATGWPRRRWPEVGRWWLLTVPVGLTLLALAADAPGWGAWLLVAGGTLAAGSVLRGWRVRGALPMWILGVAAFLAAWGVGFIAQSRSAPLDLSGTLGSSPAELACRLGLFALTWGLLTLIPGAAGGGRGGLGRVAGGLALLSLALAVALLDRPPVPWILMAAAGAALAVWRRRTPAGEGLAVSVLLALAAAVAAPVGWEIAHREVSKRWLGERTLPAMAPPSVDELDDLAAEVEAYLAAGEVQGLAPAGIEELDRQDLAFEVWHHSPLASFGGISALQVIPADGRSSVFSLGLPVDREGRIDWSPPGWSFHELPVWRDAVVSGQGELRLWGEPWARVEYWLALQPGFRLPVERREDLAAGLLLAGPRVPQPTPRGLAQVQYGLFDRRGEPLLSPWKNPPRLPAALLAGGRGELSTPTGKTDVFAAVGEDGVRALFLPRLSLLQAVERVGSHALAALALLALVGLGSQLRRVARVGVVNSWRRAWRSYSRRLVLVYSTLLVVPLALMNLIVVRVLEERLHREAQAAGQSALESAQRVLGEYVLALEPGFGIDAALDDELLRWLAGVVHHDVNLYWRSAVYASSKSELFTAGLLPRRIPGEIYSRLTLLGHGVSTRTNQADGAEYLELYAPLVVPGVPLQEARLFLSLPLLAQQEQTAAQIASLRRRGLLSAVALLVLIVALGSRLARRFTAPLTEIVAGTQRIAAGEASLGLQPMELELATLVEAIDAMAARIAEARQRLLQEKSVIEGMVDNITSGVMSLDARRRVLMANRVAVDLIGVEIGRPLDEMLAAQPRLAPLRAFLQSVEPRRPEQRTVALSAPDDRERQWSLVWVPLPGSGEPASLLVLEDVTEVLRGQRLQAWAEMARMIAHEIKNPLTPIRLSAEHMREVYASDPEGFAAVFESCTANILRQVGELQQIAGEFSTYSRIPRIEPRPGDLTAAVESVVDSYRTGSPRGIRIELRAPDEPVRASFDAKLVGRAVRNLIENALRVTPEDGRIEVRIDRDAGRARIAVTDTGPGVRPNVLPRIFDPYFSTHDSGTGLGLPIARRIAEEHGGEIVARNRRRGGLEVVIWLPAAAD